MTLFCAKRIGIVVLNLKLSIWNSRENLAQIFNKKSRIIVFGRNKKQDIQFEQKTDSKDEFLFLEG